MSHVEGNCHSSCLTWLLYVKQSHLVLSIWQQNISDSNVSQYIYWFCLQRVTLKTLGNVLNAFCFLINERYARTSPSQHTVLFIQAVIQEFLFLYWNSETSLAFIIHDIK